MIKLIFCAALAFVSSAQAQEAPKRTCNRIISLAPSVTEDLFALRLGANVVGVTRYCKFPAAVENIPKLGGLFDTNLEAAVMLTPDLIVGLPESSLLLSKFKQLNIPIIKISDRAITEIYSSLIQICEYCGCQDQAKQLVDFLKHEASNAINSRKNKPTISAALIVASSVSSGVEELYLSGKDGFYSSIFEVLNAKNVFANATAAIPSSSFETLATLNPQIIFIVEASAQKFVELQARIRSYLPNSKVIQLAADYAVIPGPRFIFLMRDIASGLNQVEMSEITQHDS